VDCRFLLQLSFDDVIGYDEVKVKLRKVLAFADPSSRRVLQRFGVSSSMGGVLLHGPPGMPTMTQTFCRL
jgi:ATP-dependent Zn protease